MDTFQIALVLGAGILGGIISTIVGGAAIVTFPALLAAGVAPAVAAASNLIAMVPTVLYSAYDDRMRLPAFDRILGTLLFFAVAGGIAGAILLLLTPPKAFQVLVPLLLGIATALFALGRPINAWMRKRTMQLHGREPRMGAGAVTALLPVSIYIGYFGAGAGVMLLAIFSIWNAGSYRNANVMKNLFASINMLPAAVLFAVQGLVDWRATALMMAGGFAGGMVGRKIARVARQEVMEIAVLVVGAILTAIYAWRYWF
jgi:uncharacterized membrane protein YfcA